MLTLLSVFPSPLALTLVTPYYEEDNFILKKKKTLLNLGLCTRLGW